MGLIFHIGPLRARWSINKEKKEGDGLVYSKRRSICRLFFRGGGEAREKINFTIKYSIQLKSQIIHFNSISNLYPVWGV